MSITYGSGTITTAVVTDVVDVGGVHTTMRDGVLLMTDRRELKIQGSFQGIVGLGVPSQSGQVASLATTKVARQPAPEGTDPSQNPFQDIINRLKDIFGDGNITLNVTVSHSGSQNPGNPLPASQSGGNITWNVTTSHSGSQSPWKPFHFPLHPSDIPASHSGSWSPSSAPPSPQSGTPNVPERLFLQEAGINRFSLCFRDGGKSGALRMGLPQFDNTIAQIGKAHWGLNLQGLSIGAFGSTPTTEFIFCGPDTMKPGMESPCGMIPDSGTTLLTGPKEQVLQLEASVCDRWDRCKRLQTSGSLNERQKSQLFKQLLFRCNSWLTESSNGLNEIPSLFFHVKGTDNSSKTFELTAWAWVTETIYANATEKQGDKLVAGGNASVKICQSSVGSMAEDYITAKNGPVWIAGSPLFYEYVVGFDYSAMAVSLERTSCEPCESGGALLSTEEDRRSRGRPRFMSALPRVPQYDVTLPL
jgi:hypothetical protein